MSASPPAADTKDLTDGRGRKLTVKEMDPADMLDLMEASGPNCGNAAWMQMAMNVCSVRAIDDVPVPMPSTRAAIKELARKLGNDGLVTVYAWGFGGNKSVAVDEAQDEAIETAKN